MKLALGWILLLLSWLWKMRKWHVMTTFDLSTDMTNWIQCEADTSLPPPSVKHSLSIWGVDSCVLANGWLDQCMPWYTYQETHSDCIWNWCIDLCDIVCTTWMHIQLKSQISITIKPTTIWYCNWIASIDIAFAADLQHHCHPSQNYNCVRCRNTKIHSNILIKLMTPHFLGHSFPSDLYCNIGDHVEWLLILGRSNNNAMTSMIAFQNRCLHITTNFISSFFKVLSSCRMQGGAPGLCFHRWSWSRTHVLKVAMASIKLTKLRRLSMFTDI